MVMKKYFVVTDVHSFYTEMKEALDNNGWDINNPDHILVCLGDLLDRGNEPMECLKFVNSIPRDRKILIRGNHEDLLEECLDRGEFYYHDLHNGTVKTVMNLCGLNESDYFNKEYHQCFQQAKDNEQLRLYLNSLQNYAEIGDYVFVHGWIPSRKYAKNKNWRLGDWSEARWFNGMEKWKQGAILKDKTIVCGHYHTSWGHSVLEKKCSEFDDDADFSPFIQKGIIALDACTAYSGLLNCFVLELED